MMIMRTLFLLLATGLTPAFAEVPNCTNCYQEGLDARQRGSLCHQRAGPRAHRRPFVQARGQHFALTRCLLPAWQIPSEPRYVKV